MINSPAISHGKFSIDSPAIGHSRLIINVEQAHLGLRGELRSQINCLCGKKASQKRPGHWAPFREATI